MNTTRLMPVEPGNRIQLPPEWAAALKLHKFALLEQTSEGILVRPCPNTVQLRAGVQWWATIG